VLGVGRAGPLGPTALVARDGSAPADQVASAGSASVPDGERDALAVLVSVPGLGPATLARLIGRFGSASETLAAARHADGIARLGAAAAPVDGRPGGVTREVAAAVVAAAGDAGRTLDAIRRHGLRIVSLDDEDYPPRLRAIELPPLALFVRGSVAAMSARRVVAVVGTRAATEAGRRLASNIGAALSAVGATVVSGLAVGIDGAAHAGVVAVGGPTVAVLGGGHGRLYPVGHARLADEIVAHGGTVVSEHAPATAPTRWSFPRRNRVIAGLAEATVVVEAGRRSGALTTAAWALEQGRGCFVVPGPVGAPTWAGCLELLRDCHGLARIVPGVAELLTDLDLPDDPAEPPGPSHGSGRPALPTVGAVLVELGPTARSVGRALVAGLTTPDDLVAATDLPIATVLAALTVLEGRGLVASAYGRYRPAGALAAAAPPGRRAAKRAARPGARPDAPRP
jgi:DNA processing protein